MDKFGYVALQQSSDSVPAAVEALCRKKPIMLVHQRLQLCQCFPKLDKPELRRNEREAAIVSGLLEGRSNLDEYLQSLASVQAKMDARAAARAKKVNKDAECSSDSDAFEVPPEMQEFFEAVLEEINPEELPPRERKRVGQARQRGADALAAAKERLDLKRKEASASVEEAVPEDTSDRYSRRSDVAWVRPYVPDIGTETCMHSVTV